MILRGGILFGVSHLRPLDDTIASGLGVIRRESYGLGA